jgi:hypothetical protein
VKKGPTSTPVSSVSSPPLYVPPTGDAPLDEIEQALVRALVAVIVEELRVEAVAAPAVPDQGRPIVPSREPVA